MLSVYLHETRHGEASSALWAHVPQPPGNDPDQTPEIPPMAPPDEGIELPPRENPSPVHDPVKR